MLHNLLWFATGLFLIEFLVKPLLPFLWLLTFVGFGMYGATQLVERK